MLHIFFINYRKKLFLKIWGYFRHWNKNFSRFLRKLFLSFSNLFDMSQKIWLHFFFFEYPIYFAVCQHFENKARGDAKKQKNSNDPSPFEATLDSISAADAASGRDPSRARVNGERRTAAFVPRLPARICLEFRRNLNRELEAARRVSDVHFVIIAPNESHFPASRRS